MCMYVQTIALKRVIVYHFVCLYTCVCAFTYVQLYVQINDRSLFHPYQLQNSSIVADGKEMFSRYSLMSFVRMW